MASEFGSDLTRESYALTAIQGFLSYFWEFWPQRLQFFHRKSMVTADNWPKILYPAESFGDNVMLEMRIVFGMPSA